MSNRGSSKRSSHKTGSSKNNSNTNNSSTNNSSTNNSSSNSNSFSNNGRVSASSSPVFDKTLLGQEYGAWGDVEVFSKVYTTADNGGHRRHPIKAQEETNNWVPTDAVRLAFDFKQRHMQHVSMGMMNELLQQLNEIWRLREKRHVARAKSRWVHQVKDLKRQLQQRVPYAEIVQKNKIDKLRRDLTDVRGQVKVGMHNAMATTLGKGEEKQLLETTLMNVSELSEQLSILASENDTLVTKLRRAHTELASYKKGTAAVGVNIPPSTARQDRDFMEGAAWFGRNAVHTTDRLSASIQQILSELRKTVTNNDIAEDIMNQLEIVVRQCRDRMRRLFEGTLEDNVVPSNNGSSTLRMDNL